MIEVEGFRKEYSDVVAVKDLSFEVESGEVFGVVGPNGAGKTTTLKSLVGLTEPTNGEIQVADGDPMEPDTRQRIGYLPEESPLYEEMTALEYLRFFADLYDVPGDVAIQRINDTLDKLDLDRRDTKTGDMSKGMKRKVAVTRSLINDPDVLIYDEPASGLDPLTTNYVVDFTREQADQGRTVVFSAHNLYHVERVCDRVLIMNEGDLVAKGDLDEIRDRYGGVEYHVEMDTELPGSERKRGSYHAIVHSMDEVEDIRCDVEERGGEVLDIRTREPSLEDIFLDVAEGNKG